MAPISSYCLCCGELFGTPGGSGSAQRFRTVTSEPGTPGADRDLSDSELLRQVTGGAASVIEEGLGSKPAFFLLATGEAAGSPGRNSHALCYRFMHESVTALSIST